MTRRFLIDTDTASDDAVALVLALRHPGVTIEAITVVAGNVPLPQAVQAALYTVELCGADVPVYAGMDRPMVRAARRTAQHVHGEDGMGDIGLPLAGRVPADGHAVNTIIDTVRAHPGEVTIVTLGPLSNLGMALRMAPDIAELIPQIVVMGGYGREIFGHTRTQEFNIMIDPEAADIVYRSGISLTQVGLDASMRYATLSAEQEARLSQAGPIGKFCVDIQRVLREFSRKSLGLENFTLPDPLAAAVALRPDLVIRSVKAHVAIELTGTHTFGATVVDHTNSSGEAPNVEVVLDVDQDRFVDLLVDAAAGRANGQ